MRCFTLLLAVACWACADDPAARVIDLEGPRGQMTAPGPWRVAVVSRGAAPQLYVAVDDAAFAPVALAPEAGVWWGSLPDAPVGAVVAYYATAGDDVVPQGAPARPRRVEVVPVVTPPPPPEPRGCTVRFVQPTDGAALGPRDDAAPQAGLQLTVVVETDAPDSSVVRLRVNEAPTRMVAEVVAGRAAFTTVTLPAGRLRLAVEAAGLEGARCGAEATVSVAGRDESGP